MLLHAMHHPDGLTAGTRLIAAAPAMSIIVFASAYAGGTHAAWRHAGHGRGVRRWQVWCFASGIVALLVALVSPLDALADQLFAAHMAQHVLLAVVAPPLIVAGAPLTAMLWLLSAEDRKRLVRWFKRLGWPRTLWTVVTAPVFAWAIHAVAMWIWHLPRLYTLALEHSVIHAAEHVSFLGTASLMWWGFVYPRQSRRAAYGLGVAALFLTMMHSGALGALLTLSKRIWFPVHGAGEAAWGLAPLEDQQLAGLIMWVPGGLLYLAAMSVLFFAWMQRGERREAITRINGFDEKRSARCEIPV